MHGAADDRGEPPVTVELLADLRTDAESALGTPVVGAITLLQRRRPPVTRPEVALGTLGLTLVL